MNPLIRLWIHIKRVYLILLYWMVGMEEGYYLTWRAFYCLELGDYSGTIRHCEKALKHSKDPFLHSALARSYVHTGRYSSRAEYLRTIYTDLDDPKMALWLALEELESGYIDESSEIVDRIKTYSHSLSSDQKEQLDDLEMSIYEADKGRREISKLKKA